VFFPKILGAWTPEQWTTFFQGFGPFLGTTTQVCFVPVLTLLAGYLHGQLKQNKARIDQHEKTLNQLTSGGNGTDTQTVYPLPLPPLNYGKPASVTPSQKQGP
jgi:hypothetical protein